MPTPSLSWALSPLPSGAGQFFQNRSHFFPEQEQFSFRTGAVFSEQEPITTEQEPFLSAS